MLICMVYPGIGILMGKTHRIYSEINLENYASFIYRLYIYLISTRCNQKLSYYARNWNFSLLFRRILFFALPSPKSYDKITGLSPSSPQHRLDIKWVTKPDRKQAFLSLYLKSITVPNSTSKAAVYHRLIVSMVTLHAIQYTWG